MSLDTVDRTRQVGHSEIRDKRLYERTRAAVLKEFVKSVGRCSITDADVEAATQQRLAKLAAANDRVASQSLFNFDDQPAAAETPASKAKLPSRSPRRIPSDANALASRSEANAKAERRRTSRRIEALAEFEAAGHRGLTRYELAQRLGCEQCSITQTVRELVASSQVVELRERRRSASGGEGCVLVVPLFAEGRDK